MIRIAKNSLSRLLAPTLTRTTVAAMLALAASAALAPRVAFAQDAQPTTEPSAPAAPADMPPPAEAPATPPADAPATEPAAATPAAATPAAATPAAAPAASSDVKRAAEDFWHYGKIARYDLAAASGQKLLASGAAPADVLKAFEDIASDRHDNLDEWLLRLQSVDATKDVTAQISKVLNEGRYTRRADPNYIKMNIERLSTSEKGYQNGIAQLRDAGELAVPLMVQYLREPSQRQYHASIRRAMRDMGRYALNPLVAATEMNDGATLAVIATMLGDLGYDAAVPYLAKIVAAQGIEQPAKVAAADSIRRITGSDTKSINVAESFYQLGEKLYYDTAAIAYDARNEKGYVWFWTNDKGLTKLDVPKEIFNELMAMRECEYALKLGGSQGDALSLWLASNYKREVEMPQGETDATRAQGQPDAHYYGVSAGSQYLNSALARALRDKNAPLALRVITSLQDIAGQSSALPGGTGPLVDAMAYPDKVVRFESAFAIAASLPQRSFTGQERVVPLLAEAISQTGQPSVVVAMPNQEQLNAMLEALKGAGYAAAGGVNSDAAATAANELPSVDVLLISDDLPADQVERLIAQNLQGAKLASAAKLVMVKSSASRYEARASTDSMLSLTQARDAEHLKPAIEEARKKAGSLPVDPAVATTYATRSGNLLARLAISRGQVLDLNAAGPTLLAALNDQRPEIVKLAGNVLALMNMPDAQVGLLTIASEEKTADDVKISLYKSLATSAKFFGNLLEPQHINSLVKVVSDAQNLEVRSAAAEAHGALNLPADQAKSLIVKQSKM